MNVSPVTTRARGGEGTIFNLSLSLSFSFSSSSPDPVPRDQPELRAVLEEDVAGRLRRVDADAVVGDDRGGGRRDLELFSVREFFFLFSCRGGGG